MISFIGALIKSRSMVSSFAIALAIHLGFSIASGIFRLYTLFKQSPQEALANCLNETAEDSEAAKTCHDGLAVMKGVMIAIYVITWLIQLCVYPILAKKNKNSIILTSHSHSPHRRLLCGGTVCRTTGGRRDGQAHCRYPSNWVRDEHPSDDHLQWIRPLSGRLIPLH